MFDLSGYIGDIARRLLGEPNRALSTKTQLRFGSNGSIAVEIAGARRGRWYDHEHGIGGGPWEMLRIKGGFANGQAEKWLRDNLGIETRPKTNGADSSQRQRQRQHILKTFDYHDEEGALLFKVDRWGAKKNLHSARTGRQRRLDEGQRRNEGCPAGALPIAPPRSRDGPGQWNPLAGLHP